MTERVSRALLLAVSGLLFLGSAAALWLESAPLFSSAGTLPTRVDAFVQAPPRPGLSLKSMQLVADDCDRALDSTEAKVLRTPNRKALIDNCRRAAEGLVAAVPGFGPGWLVLAKTAVLEQNSQTFNAALVRAQQLTPSEGWLAARRFLLAADHRGRLEEAGLRSLAADIAVLAHQPAGAELLAGRYLADAGLAELIAAELEAAPESAKANFVRALRRLAAGRT